jgi:hypothetical protein
MPDSSGDEIRGQMQRLGQVRRGARRDRLAIEWGTFIFSKHAPAILGAHRMTP